MGANGLATAGPRLVGLRLSFIGFRQGSRLPKTTTTVPSIFREFVSRTEGAVDAAVIECRLVVGRVHRGAPMNTREFGSVPTYASSYFLDVTAVLC